MMCGGTGAMEEADAEVQEICDKVRHEVVEKTGKNFVDFIAKRYKTQLVNGTNYFVKVQVGGDEYIHLRIHKALPCNGGAVTLAGVQESKTQGDAVDYF
ncbi:cystatin-B-like [Pholidichthys leucotaenia]